MAAFGPPPAQTGSFLPSKAPADAAAPTATPVVPRARAIAPARWRPGARPWPTGRCVPTGGRFRADPDHATWAAPVASDVAGSWNGRSTILACDGTPLTRTMTR